MKLPLARICVPLSVVFAFALFSLSDHRASLPDAAVHAASQQTPVTCADSYNSQEQFPPTPTEIDSSCAAIPADSSGAVAQSNFDLYSWLSFVAANWPVDPTTCAADTGASILNNPPAVPVWLSYASDSSVFVRAPLKPAPWCAQPAPGKLKGMSARAGALSAQRMARIARLPVGVRKLAIAHPEVSLYLSHNAKGAELTSTLKVNLAALPPELQGILQATGEPIVDQNGRFARYQITMSQPEYRYLVSNHLWTAAGQQAISSISFPSSSRTSGDIGSVEFKAAWKVIGKNDNPSHFFTQWAIIYNDGSGDPSPEKQPVLVGLIGFHILHKTQSHPTWLWSTFEQVENVTQSFFNPHCPTCVPNQPPTLKPYQELNAQGQPLNPPTQIVPVVHPDPEVVALNKSFQQLLSGTPWAYYELISTQWVGNLGTAPKPAELGNSVLETYVKPGPKTYGCLQCHNYAVAFPSQKPSDRSFIISANQ